MSSDYESSQKRLEDGSQQPTISSRVQKNQKQSESAPKEATADDDEDKYTSIEQTINTNRDGI